MSVTVVATFIPKPEHREELIAALVDVIPKVHAHHDGCELYALQMGDDRLVVIEKWASGELLQAHSTTPDMTAFGEAVAGMLAKPLDIMVLNPHAVGTPEQGTL